MKLRTHTIELVEVRDKVFGRLVAKHAKENAKELTVLPHVLRNLLVRLVVLVVQDQRRVTPPSLDFRGHFIKTKIINLILQSQYYRHTKRYTCMVFLSPSNIVWFLFLLIKLVCDV